MINWDVCNTNKCSTIFFNIIIIHLIYNAIIKHWHTCRDTCKIQLCIYNNITNYLIMQRWLISRISQLIDQNTFFLKMFLYQPRAFTQNARRIMWYFLSLFVCCTNMKCENILTDILSYYSYIHVQYLLGAISIFLFSVVINGRDAFLHIVHFSHHMMRRVLYIWISSIRYLYRIADRDYYLATYF